MADPVRSEGGEKELSYKSEFVELAIEHDAVGTRKGNDAETVGPVRIISSPSASRIQSGNSRAEVTPDLAVEASVSTPSKKLRQSSSFSGFSSREAGCGVSRTMAQGGGSFNRSASDIVCGTPRSGRSIAGKPPVDADTTSTNRNQGVLQKEAVTPSKNANRALKYGGAPSNASSVAGLSSTRATSSAANQLRSAGTSGPVQISSQLRNEQHFYLEDDPSFWQDHNVQVSGAIAETFHSVVSAGYPVFAAIIFGCSSMLARLVQDPKTHPIVQAMISSKLYKERTQMLSLVCILLCRY